MIWITIWKITLILGLILFFGVTVWIIIGGIKELKTILNTLEK